MPNFKLVPADPSYATAEFVAHDAGAVLTFISHLECSEADVLQDGDYLLSIRLGSNGMWTIFQRDGAFAPAEVTCFG